MATQRNTSFWSGASPVSGWVAFAALMMLIVGVVNVLQGIVALIFRGRTVVVQNNLYVVNLNSFGLTLVVFGGVLILVGIGLFTMKPWARIAAIILVALHAVAQIGWLAAYPAWSLLMLVLDVVVLYALTARWSDADAGSTRAREMTPPTSDATREVDTSRDISGVHTSARG